MSTSVITRPTVSIGSKGQDVASIQTALQNAGFSPGRIDSDFGSKTDTAVRNFQKAHNLKVDGIVGKDTWALLQKYSTPNKVHVVKQGDSLWKIAQKFGVSVDAIKKANPNINVNNLQIGSQVTIPNTRGGGRPTSMPELSPRNYKEMTVTATAYTAYCRGCTGKTYTGIDLRANPNKKVIAVDPKVIPLNSKVEVPGYGTAIAGDIGGAITGNKVDLFMPNKQEAINWGIRQVKIKVYQ